MHSDPYHLDQRAVQAGFNRAASTYGAEAVLQAQIRDQLAKRLDLTNLEPDFVLDLGCSVGDGYGLLHQRYPDAKVVGLDFSANMLEQAQHRYEGGQWVLADFTILPFADQSMDLVFCNLALHCVNDLDRVLAEAIRVLKPAGLFTFSSLGPDSLWQLRSAWNEVDTHVHIHRFLDMHDVGDGLIRAGFSEPVMDVDTITLIYKSGLAAMRDLRLIGEGNCASSRLKGLLSRDKYQKLLSACRQTMVNNRFHSTFEVVFGQAWGTSEINQTKYLGGDVHIPVSAIRRR